MNYNDQLASINQQITNLQKPTLFQKPHSVIPVESISGAEAILKEMPAGSSDIVAHKTENILYLLSRDENGIPAPIKVLKFEVIDLEDDPTAYVTKKDFDNFKNELKAMLAERGNA